ncbi:MAG: hypothetical protein ACRCS9_04695 [Hyphomicrobium sp.]
MSAVIISLADVRARRSAQPAPIAALNEPTSTAARFHFWTGASGKRYVHTVYSLFDCPPLGLANFVLVRRDGKTARSVLAIGRLNGDNAAFNLSEIRQRGTTLGADEIHVHLLATSAQECLAVEIDLKSAEFAARAN